MPVSISGAGSISGLDQGFNVTTGSVGVGTTNPRTDLQVGAFGSGSDSNIQLATGTSGASNILFGDDSGGTDWYKGFIKYNHSTDNLELYTTDDLIHYTGGTERLRITSGGKVGIRTDNPKQIFSVVGRANFDLQGDYYGAWIDGDSQGSSSFNVGAWHNVGGRMRNEGSHLVLETQNTSHWIQLQPSGGNISVGSNNPNGLLALTASSGRILTLRNSTTGSASGDGSYLALNGSDFQIANAESANVILYTADTERLRIASDGDIEYKYDDADTDAEIGASQIPHGLRIYNTNNTLGRLAGIHFSHGSAGTANAGIFHETTNTSSGSTTCLGDLVFYTKNSGVSNMTEKLRITSDGKLCVNTTLSNYGVVQIRDASGDSTTSAIQVENASSGNSTTNVILRSVSLNSGAWANAEYRAKSHDFCFQATPAVTVLGNFGPWAEGNKGTTRGTIHLRPASTDHMGGAITFGASDRDSGETAMAGIYTRTDGNYGTKMYFATTNSYAAGPKNAMFIDHSGYVIDSNRPYIYGSVTNTTGTGIANSMHVDSSRNLSFSNSRITVPVSGVYHICFNTICDSTTGRRDAQIRMNGVIKVNSLNDNNTTGHHYRGMSISLMMSANDYIEFNNQDWYNPSVTTMEYWRTVSVVFLG